MAITVKIGGERWSVEGVESEINCRDIHIGEEGKFEYTVRQKQSTASISMNITKKSILS